MDILAVVRHGDYDTQSRDWGLTDRGERQIAALAKTLKQRFGDRSVLILTSPTTRTCSSAAILAREFGCTYEEHDILESSGGYLDESRMIEAIEVVNSVAHQAHVLVLVTHLEYVKDFPAYYGAKQLGTRGWEREKIDKGGAVLIDRKALALERIPPTL